VLTTKELMLLKDNIKMMQNNIELSQTFCEMTGDQQVKALCQQMTNDHQSYLQTLMKHITTATVQ